MLDSRPPELIILKQYGGNWDQYIEAIYEYYLKEIVNGQLTHQKLPIRCQFHPTYNNKGFSFWHTISEGTTEETRTADLRRCERVRWIPWVITHAKDGINSEITWWENKRKHNTHSVLLFEQES